MKDSREGIREVEIEGELVSLKKSDLPLIGGWSVVHPIKDYNGKIIWPNMLFGGKANGIKLLVILLIFAMFLYGVSQMLASCGHMAENPCLYCSSSYEYQPMTDLEIELSGLYNEYDQVNLKDGEQAERG